MARNLRDACVTHERFTSQIYVTLVLGCLDQLWCYADTHIREDDTLDLGADEIDELVGLKGFASLMPVDWLVILDANSVQLPDFHAHNGTESKRRALTQKRTSRYRDARASHDTTELSRTSVTTASPDQTRPDQTRPKKEIEARSARAYSLTEDFSLTPERRAIAEAENLDPDRVFANFADYWRAASGAKARKCDWDATWRVWCRNQLSKPGAPGKRGWRPDPDPPLGAEHA
jgi:hypothetical protein